MGVLFDYFAAPDNDAAAATIDLVGGPSEASLPTVQLKGVDPFVQLGTAESPLTGVDYDLAPVAMADEGARLIVPLTWPPC
ncbi:hypothetical protein AB0E55_01555 [Amycolatopsis keratiniphila]|uniref:hypothetical protein n=1 Tax=Amycolatopsis keratiniphila TaxID=129921 RepID=UPI0033DBDFF7